jgi:hypothetical protein
MDIIEVRFDDSLFMVAPSFVSLLAASTLTPLFFFSFSLDYRKRAVLASSATMALAVWFSTRRKIICLQDAGIGTR